MDNILKVSEVFKSIQGEGRYQGVPATFVRLSGCSRVCSFCDSKYHIEGKKESYEWLHNYITKNITPTIIFTGGEPLAQWGELKKFLNKYYYFASKGFHLETNGDLINSVEKLDEILKYFDYICISPKEVKVAKKISEILREYKNKYCCKSNHFADIKVVTDLHKIGIDMLQYATTLMPLTTYNEEKDKVIRQGVWTYCIHKNLFYSARLHVGVWGKARKI